MDFTALGDSLLQGCADLKLELDPDQTHRLLQHLSLLQHWGRKTNLSGIRNPDEMLSKHVLDSLSASPFITGCSLVDVGSGAGFPGIPLAVADRQLQVSLVETNARKVAFLRHVVALLRVENVTVWRTRCEAMAERTFDTVISRAFVPLVQLPSKLAHLCAPVGGRILAMAGRLESHDLATITSAGWCVQVRPVCVPGLSAQRNIVIIER